MFCSFKIPCSFKSIQDVIRNEITTENTQIYTDCQFYFKQINNQASSYFYICSKVNTIYSIID